MHFLNKLEHYEAGSLSELTSKEFEDTNEAGGDGTPIGGYGNIME